MRHRVPPPVLLLAVALCCVAGPRHAGAAEPVTAVAGEVLVRLVAEADVGAVARAYKLDPSSAAIERLGALPIYRLKITDGAPPERRAWQLSADRRVVYAEPNYLSMLPETRQRSSWTVGEGDGDAYVRQWAAEQIHLEQAHALTRGAGVVVAVLDTGVDLGHPALSGRLVRGYDFVAGDADPSEEGRAGDGGAYGHGTHVAGLVALSAPESAVMPLRTIGPDGRGTVWSQVEGLQYAAENGADVVNLSFSMSLRSLVLADVLRQVTCASGSLPVCRQAVRPGVVVVAAAGNSGLRVKEYPAAEQLPGLLAVAASTADDELAIFSTYGWWVQVAAPGVQVLSSVPGGAYASWSGTSMSAPLAAGVAALVRASEPSARPAHVVAQIVCTADGLEGAVRSRVDAAGAVGDGEEREDFREDAERSP